MNEEDLKQPTTISQGPAAPSTFKSKEANYGGRKVSIIRVANISDGDNLDLSVPHFLVRGEDGSKLVVPVSEVSIPKE